MYEDFYKMDGLMHLWNNIKENEIRMHSISYDNISQIDTIHAHHFFIEVPVPSQESEQSCTGVLIELSICLCLRFFY